MLKTKRSSSSRYVCAYPTCQSNANLIQPSRGTQCEVLRKYNFLITDRSVTCQNHLDTGAWTNVYIVGTLNNFTAEQIDRMHEILRDQTPIYDRNASSGNKLDFTFPNV